MVRPRLQHWIFSLTGTAAIFAAGYGLGKSTPNLATESAPTACTVPAQTGTIYSNPWTEGTPAPAVSAPAPVAPLASAPVPATVADPLAALIALPADAEASERDRLLSRLNSAMSNDGGLRRRVVAAYLKGAEEPARHMLEMALAAAGTPELEKELLDSSRANHPRADRLASLRLLGAVGLGTQENRSMLMESLRNGSANDPQLIAATLSALSPQGPISTSEQAAVTATLSAYLQSPDATVREQAIDAYVAWAPRETSTVQLLKNAILDPSPEVRLTAVSAMAAATGAGADVQPVLLARMLDEREAPGVRKAAASALAAFPMDSTTMSAHAAFSAAHMREP